jgi:hypothetical protein
MRPRRHENIATREWSAMCERRTNKRLWAIWATILLVAIGAAALPASAEAAVYWTNAGANTVGRGNLDGSGVNQSFITGANNPQGVAVDGSHVYWTNAAANTVGRANLDGSGVNQSFITGANLPAGVAVDSFLRASATAVACSPATLTLPNSANCTATVTGAAAGPSPTGTVSFSSSGAGSFSPTTSCALVAAEAGQSACQLTYTPSATGAHAITADYTDGLFYAESFGAAALAVLAPPPPQAVAARGTLTVAKAGSGAGTVTSTDDRISCGSSCSHAYDAGTRVTLKAAPAPGSSFAGFSGSGCSGTGPCTVTVSSDQSVTATFAASNDFRLGKLRLNRKDGTAKLPVSVPGPGRLLLTGKAITTQAKSASSRATIVLLVKPTRSTSHKLRRNGTAKVTARVTYTPTGGQRRTVSKTLTLKRTRR